MIIIYLYELNTLLKRRIIYHSGPTNSGKTFTALEALKQSQNGSYYYDNIFFSKGRRKI